MPQSDLLQTITRTAMQARDRTLEIEALELRVKELNVQLHQLTRSDLPDLMAQAHMTKFTLQAQGNIPAYEITAGPYIRANIAASWPEEKRQEAFAWLTENGHGDLIKTELTISFPRDARERAMTVAAQLQRQGLTPHIDEAVHSGTLSKWLKEATAEGLVVPLDIVGGDVGRIVKLKIIEGE